MTKKSAVILACLFVCRLPLMAADTIDDFLGLKFGADQETAKTTLLERGFKLKDDKEAGVLKCDAGSYSGQTVKSVNLEFTDNKFRRATVVFEVHSGKREECVRLGLEAYDTVRKALTEKYGNPTSSTSVSKSKLLSGKNPRNTMFKAAWKTKGALNGGERTITLSTTTIALYSWVFNVVYDDGAPNQGGPRKDI